MKKSIAKLVAVWLISTFSAATIEQYGHPDNNLQMLLCLGIICSACFIIAFYED
jgi:hypothetical protein